MSLIRRLMVCKSVEELREKIEEIERVVE